jgi:leucyl aminopeptidase
MKISAPLRSAPRIEQRPGAATEATLAEAQAAILIGPESLARHLPANLPHAAVIRARLRRQTQACPSHPLLSLDLPNARATRLELAAVKDDITAFDLLTLTRKLVANALVTRPEVLYLIMHALEGALATRVAEALVAALLAALATAPRYQSKDAPAYAPRRIALQGLARRLDLTRTQAEAEGNALARWYTQLPPNLLTPAAYRREVARLARRYGWRMRFYDQRALTRLGAGAFLAVAQASPAQDAGIVHLRYAPRTSTKRTPLALVGKGICFDTGGANLKPAKYMLGMHEDMEGSAVALGVLAALTRLKVPYPVECWLALAQNHIGPKSYKPNDVVTAMNGTTVEIIHTDAEGRMVLADTLTLAARGKPALMLDYATLTGSCIHALGTRMSGAFSNRPELHAPIQEAGRESGERVWPFPTDSDYDELLESKIADIRQCTLEGEADHILAARFLSRFVPERVPWVHVDLAAGNHKGGLAHIPTDVTGFGVRFTLALLDRTDAFKRGA